MLNTFLRLYLSIYASGCGSYKNQHDQSYLPSFRWVIPAAEAASGFPVEEPGLKGDFTEVRGLRLRVESDCFGGDRDLRSNLEAFLGSGSFWSNLDRLELRPSSSAMISNFEGCE